MAADVAAAIKAAASKLGRPYVWGATGPNSFDCSGLTSWAWKQAGVEIPRTSQQQAKYGTAVKLANIQPGDLITSNWGSGPNSHVGMYVGGGRLIHAPRPGSQVKYAKLDDLYKSKINAIRRVPGAGKVGQADLDLTPGLDLGADALEGLGGLLGGDLGDTLLGPVKAIGIAAASVAQSVTHVGAFAEFLMKLALPSTWVRAACGALGAVMLFLGLGFLVREARGAA